jgi:molybdopterin-guanine dinucleotide biosynthesis protein A
MADRSCTGVILAGGENKRFSGHEKSLLKIGSRKIFEHVYAIFRELFDTTLLVTNCPEKYLQYDVPMVSDLIDLRSSLTGLYTGLFYTNTPYAFFAACDTPFLKKGLVQVVLDNIEPNQDIVIPRTRMGYEPLCAAYSTRCVKPARRQLDTGRLKIRGLFENMRVNEIPEHRLRMVDPDLESFFNINTPLDLEKAEKMACKGIATL